MRVLVVGSGGREHALAWKLAKEAEVFCAPGNPGIAADCECIQVSQKDADGLIELCRRKEIDLVVIGPEDPLIQGLADRLRDAGRLVFGPGARGAQIEGSKSYSKALMAAAGVPTARFASFTDPKAAVDFARELAGVGGGVVVKASGNALGKGVFVCEDAAEAEQAIEKMMLDRAFGDAGAAVVVEERLVGPEFSLLTLCSDQSLHSLPVARDYKRAHTGDKGPNTGGMGSVSPVEWVGDSLTREAEERVARPILSALAQQGISYRGVLFSGLLVQNGVPYCLEYNARLGDPETQSLMMRIGSGFADALMACAKGESVPNVEVLPNAAVTVVVASRGYPGEYPKGLPIDLGTVPEGVKIFHAGTAMSAGKLITSGGRVLAATAEAPELASARAKAYEAARSVRIEGSYFRDDIAL